MDEKQLKDDITYIKNMIEKNRRSLIDNGIMYISTGVYIVIGVVGSYILGVAGKMNFTPAMWLILMTLLVLFNFIANKKLGKKRRAKTFASEIFASTWAACGIPIAVVSVLFFVTRTVPLTSLFIIVSSILGIGYYLTGVINELKFMKILAFGWWSFVVVTIFWNYIGEEYQLSLLFAALIFVLEVVPGIIIYTRWKRVYNE